MLRIVSRNDVQRHGRRGHGTQDPEQQELTLCRGKGDGRWLEERELGQRWTHVRSARLSLNSLHLHQYFMGVMNVLADSGSEQLHGT
jgi:hypothetical protein